MSGPPFDDPTRQTLARLTAEARASGEARRTRHVHVGAKAGEALAAWLAREAPERTMDLVVADANTWRAAGEAVHGALEAAGRAVRPVVLEPRHGDDELTCEDGVIEALSTFLDVSPALNPIAVGAGTVNDIVKMAADRHGRGYQVVPTAASMNGYTSAIAAVLSKGVKRTLPCAQPEAVFIDPAVLSAAPAHLNQAGFGDLLSKPFSHADWLLSHLVRGVPYSAEAAQLLDPAYTRLLEEAPGVATGDRGAMELLAVTLLVSGFSMAMAGTSAPASGGEHLVSHYWDMEQHCQHQPLVGLHGTQVGVATRLSALLFERLVALDPDALDPDAAAAARPDDEAWDTPHVASRHPRLTPDVRAEVVAQHRAKQKVGAELRDELARVKADWPEIRGRIADCLVPAARIDRALRESGGARVASDLHVPPARLEHTLTVCREIRSRYVALDLIGDLGLLEGWAHDLAHTTEAT